MIKEITDREFDRIVEESLVPVLIAFWQPGCRHCQSLTRELEHIQDAQGDQILIFRMNVQENFLIPGELEIQSLPTLALYTHGKFERFIGGLGKKENILNQIFS